MSTETTLQTAGEIGSPSTARRRMARLTRACRVRKLAPWMGVAAWVLLCGWMPTRALSDEPAAVFSVERIEGPPLSGELAGIGPDWQLRLKTSAGDQTLSAGEVVALRRVGEATAMAKKPRRFLLAVNGDRLRFGRIVAGSAERLRVDRDLAGELEVPLESLAAVLFDAPEAPEAFEELCRRFQQERRKQDLVRFRNGDELSGTLEQIEADRLRMEVGKTVRTAKLETVASVALSTELVKLPRQAGLAAEVTLSDDSRVSLVDATLEGGKLAGRTHWGAPLRVGLDRVVAIRFQGGRVEYLSDLDPTSYKGGKYLDLDWPYRRDRSASDKLIAIGGKRYARGIGMHSPARLTYELAGRYHRFQAMVGLDDSVGGAGSVVCRVRVDGREKFASGVLRGWGAAATVDLDITGAKTLTLVVEMADRGYVMDHVDWAEARLVK